MLTTSRAVALVIENPWGRGQARLAILGCALLNNRASLAGLAGIMNLPEGVASTILQGLVIQGDLKKFGSFFAATCLLPYEEEEAAAEENLARSYRKTNKPIPRAVRREIFERDGWRCHYCNSMEHLTVDHVVPRSRGGTDDASNLVAACRPCNTAKKDRHYEEFVHSRLVGGWV